MARFQAILNLERESRRTDKRSIYNDINLSVHTVGKWKNILWKSCGVNTARLLKYVWPFFKTMHKRVNQI